MREQDEYISNELRTLLDKTKRADEFAVPAGYFEDSEHKLLSAAESEMRGGDDEVWFDRQAANIFTQVRIDAAATRQDEWIVPSGYFESAAYEILHKTKATGRVVRMTPADRTRVWYATAAAACIAFIMVMVWPEGAVPGKLSFAQQLEAANLSDDDLQYFATEEDYEMLIAEELDWLGDTLVTDSVALKSGKTTDQPRPFKEEKKKNSIKPNKKKTTLTWDDITEEELLEYLLDEGDADLMDDL
ncbi:MAG: hypothetical protein ACKVOR_08305 [Flavobacteriales bacterium]